MHRAPRAVVPSALVVLGLASLFATGCSLKSFVADHVTGSLGDTKTAFYAERSVKHATAAAPGLLMLLDGFIVSSPDNEELLAAGAEMNCSYALGMLEAYDPPYASRLYDKGRDYALRALEQDSDRIAAALGAPVEELEQVLREDFDEDDVPALFWAGMCWGSWINVNLDDMSAIADLPRAVAFMDRVIELNERYFHAGPHLFKAMVAASRPKMAGGKPEVAQEHFDKVFALTENKFPLAYVFYAKSYAVQTQDRRLYVSSLRRVLEMPDGVDPKSPLFTAVAKKRAAELLAEVDDHFLPDLDSDPDPGSGASGDDDDLRDLLDE